MRIKCWNCNYIYSADDNEEEEFECPECYALNTTRDEHIEEIK